MHLRTPRFHRLLFMDTRHGLHITSLYDRYVLLLVLTKSYWFLPTGSVPQLFLARRLCKRIAWRNIADMRASVLLFKKRGIFRPFNIVRFKILKRHADSKSCPKTSACVKRLLSLVWAYPLPHPGQKAWLSHSNRTGWFPVEKYQGPILAAGSQDASQRSHLTGSAERVWCQFESCHSRGRDRACNNWCHTKQNPEQHSRIRNSMISLYLCNRGLCLVSAPMP